MVQGAKNRENVDERAQVHWVVRAKTTCQNPDRGCKPTSLKAHWLVLAGAGGLGSNFIAKNLPVFR